MTQQTIGFLHPGAMGISLAAAAQNAGQTVYWVSAGRSEQTRARAAQHGLRDAETLAQLCAVCEVIVSICPPHAAEDVAQAVAAHGFRGLYLDANAIAPQRARRIAALVEAAGANFVDGSVIGPPAWKPNATWLYLSGARAQAAAACFAAGPLVATVIGATPGNASALKMCYAAYTKGTTALLAAILGAAEALEVRADLETQWARDGSDFAASTNRRVREVTAKAWRFQGEMDEIAATFRDAGLPGGFHAAAADIYGRLAEFKDAPATPPLEEVLAALCRTPDIASV